MLHWLEATHVYIGAQTSRDNRLFSHAQRADIGLTKSWLE